MNKTDYVQWLENRLSTELSKIDDNQFWIKIGQEELFLIFKKDSIVLNFDGIDYKSLNFNEFKINTEKVIVEILSIYPSAMLGLQYKNKNKVESA